MATLGHCWACGRLSQGVHSVEVSGPERWAEICSPCISAIIEFGHARPDDPLPISTREHNPALFLSPRALRGSALPRWLQWRGMSAQALLDDLNIGVAPVDVETLIRMGGVMLEFCSGSSEWAGDVEFNENGACFGSTRTN